MKTLRHNEKCDVALELDDDGRYRVIAGGEVLVETSVESLATVTYDEAVEDRDPAKELRRRERAHFEMQAVRSEAFDRRAANSRKSGGRGGRGGV